MIKAGKELLKKTFAYRLAANWRDVHRWQKAGRPAPPPQFIKERTIQEYRDRFGPRVLVETGTFLGDMVYANRDNFERIYSIELDERLHREAQHRFARWPHITILQGDSAEVLPRVLRELDEPALFWLDGHYSGGFTARGREDTPVRQELQQIANHRVHGHIILVDDARCFGSDPGYPTLDELRACYPSSEGWDLYELDDMIRLYRRRSA
jgi:hypothetical protein